MNDKLSGLIHKRDDKGRFAKGGCGKLLGTKSKTTRYKDMILDYILSCDFDEMETKIDATGKKIKKRVFSKQHLATLAATLIPKETALKVTRNTRTFVDINITKKTDNDLNDSLLNALSQRGGGQIIEEVPAEIVDGSSE